VTLARTGILSGTPTAAGTFNFTVAVADSEQPPSVATGDFTIVINGTLHVTTSSLPNAAQGVLYSATLAAGGGMSPYSWTITQGSLPAGFSLNASTGVISGTATTSGTSNFTVQASDGERPAMTASASLSVTVNPPPPRGAALYTSFNPIASGNSLGLQIQSDGSLMPLPSSPEAAINGTGFAASPTLPLIFESSNGFDAFEALVVNPDYSLTLNSSVTLPSYPGVATVDPTGADVYLPGTIDNNGTQGINVFSANGSLQLLHTVALPSGLTGTELVFTPDGNLAFMRVCQGDGSAPALLSFTRSSDGNLSLVSTYPLASCPYARALAVSPDGRYLASGEIQIYSIANDGTLSPVLPQPFTFIVDGNTLLTSDLTWDSSGSYLLASANYCPPPGRMCGGGIGVLQFSGSSLTQTTSPGLGGSGIGRVRRTGSLVYGMGLCALPGDCFSSLYGYDLLNGQLTAVPGSPYTSYGNADDMIIY
jgi:hypothetical protein